MRIRALSWAILAALAACTASAPMPPPPQPPNGSASPMTLAPPMVGMPDVVSSAPLGLRGSSPGATMVVVQTGAAVNPVGLTLPDGSFCVDVPLVAGSNTLHVVALSQGNMSAETIVKVTLDPSSPNKVATCVPPQDTTTTCTGTDAPCDPLCNGCKEDAFQPNSQPSQAPAINMKSTYHLTMCPCRAQWFTFVAFKGQPVGFTASYPSGTTFNLDLALFRAGDVLPQITSAAAVATSTSGTSGSNTTRALTFTAPSGIAYYLRIAPSAGSSGHGDFTLTTP
jgi:hypothetical protein